jgi:uncharacterized spore protein YtfJ
MGDSCPCCIVLYGADVPCLYEVGVRMMQIEEVCRLLGRLTAIAHQIIDDVEAVSKTSEHDLFYMRMVDNAQDLEVALQIQQQLAQNTRQGETL